ncbi:MAG: tRNA (cytidine(34)-2'-O)-methyltransferase [Planctomycetes bacterium]|nr:tRNA (cytidine(34)-2'-O)-methyltransferase [Planctomycetota bacterium]
MSDPLFNIVLIHPQIPNNTGNVGRTAAVTGCRLHIVRPIAFDMDEQAVRRAGLDYWHLVDCREHESWEAFLRSERPQRVWLYSSHATLPHWKAPMRRGDFLLFGNETAGTPPEIHQWVDRDFGADHRIRFPLRDHPDCRSLNLATAVACGVYEGIRQLSTSGDCIPL